MKKLEQPPIRMYGDLWVKDPHTNEVITIAEYMRRHCSIGGKNPEAKIRQATRNISENKGGDA